MCGSAVTGGAFVVYKGDDFMRHDCRELLEYKRLASDSIADYTDCLDRKAAVFVDSAVARV